VYQLTAKDSLNQTNSANASTSTVVLPGAPGVPSFSNIAATSATASWTAASGTITSYAYNVNGGGFVSVGSGLSVSLTGLSANTTYTVHVHAINSAGAGPDSVGSFTTPLATFTDNPIMTSGGPIGTNSGGNGGFIYGGGEGAMNPTVTSNGFTYQQLTNQWAPPHSGGYFIQCIFAVKGFAGDPGQGWLVSVADSGSFVHTAASASYSYSNGTAQWLWTNAPFAMAAGNNPYTIVHH
jgi:hypothetical protein